MQCMHGAHECRLGWLGGRLAGWRERVQAVPRRHQDHGLHLHSRRCSERRTPAPPRRWLRRMAAGTTGSSAWTNGYVGCHGPM